MSGSLTGTSGVFSNCLPVSSVGLARLPTIQVDILSTTVACKDKQGTHCSSFFYVKFIFLFNTSLQFYVGSLRLTLNVSLFTKTVENKAIQVYCSIVYIRFTLQINPRGLKNTLVDPGMLGFHHPITLGSSRSFSSKDF